MSLQLSFLAPLKQDIETIEKIMKGQAYNYHPDLGAAMDILISSGGKRIRPSLTLLVGKMLGASKERLLTLGASIELLHTATLVHDDLIDNSILRRGNPTLNSLWAPDATVLTGDFLFAAAAQLAAEVDSLPVMKIFAQTLMTIVNGEITQLFTARCQVNRDEYYKKIYAKTASLFETSTTTAAIISQVDTEVVDKIRRFGRYIGNAFQIIDDILDFTGDPAIMGKPAGSDLRHGLVTLPAICYIEAHPDDTNIQFLMEKDCTKDEERISNLVSSICNSGAIEAAYQEACTLVENGISCLQDFPQSFERNSLEDLARYIIKRNN